MLGLRPHVALFDYSQVAPTAHGDFAPVFTEFTHAIRYRTKKLNEDFLKQYPDS
jgi:hypothetical protein